MVRLYKTTNCPFCKEMENKLNERNIEFEIVDISERQAIGERLLEVVEAQTGSDQLFVPIILVNKQLLIPESSFNTIDEGIELVEKLRNL